MSCVTIERKDKYVYIKCEKCGHVLITNDPSYSLAPIRKHQIKAISSCEHFQVIETENGIEIIPRES